ncbi:MAG TPA: magnesium transporter CorA family protein [Mycobacteriales bacterium]|nr:magnesium transporter CorA family protein [Mycobacteriales bacterium]
MTEHPQPATAEPAAEPAAPAEPAAGPDGQQADPPAERTGARPAATAVEPTTAEPAAAAGADPTGGPLAGSGCTSRAWRNGVLEAENFPLAQVSDYLAQEDCLVWADVCTPNQEDLQHIADELGLAPLAVEDAVSRSERPKADRYASHLYVNTYAVDLDVESGALRTAQIGAFVLPRVLVTVRQDPWFGTDSFVARWDANPDLMKHGVATLLHGLIDLVVDTHFDTVQALDDEIETLEDRLFEAHPVSAEVQRRTFALRKSLVQLRRVVLPTREVVNTLLRRDLHLVPPEMQPYFQDVYDHVLRASEWTESLRDMVSTIFETNLSLQDARLNNVVKKLSAWAAIIAVPTAVTGFYGQNVPYPGYGQWSGFVASVVVTVVLGVGFYLGFRRQGWL